MRKKKLSMVLAVLSASFLAVGLAACKQGEEQQEEDKSIKIVSMGQTAKNAITLTDAAKEADLTAELADFVVNGIEYDIEPVNELTGGDCDVLFGENVSYGHIGTYFVALKPKAEVTLGEDEVVKNPDGAVTRLTVEIVHDWDGGKNDASRECKHCHATYSTKELAEGSEETLAFNGFHDDNNTLSGETIVQPYDGAATFTVGRLTKGTSITVNTYARADSTSATWYFPIIGFADFDLGEYGIGGKGTSVLVRNEGWVLINGIGTPRMLAALAGGADEGKNYGSRTADTTDLDKRPEGYDDWKSNSKYASYADLTEGLPMTAADYTEWAVYAEGDQLYSQDYEVTGDSNPNGIQTVLTWTYRDDGIIELIISNPGIKSELVSRIKVPDNDKGYYDTIMHGEMMTYTIGSASYVTPMTLENITATANKDKSYLANTKLDYSDIAVSAKYQQDNDRHNETTGYDIYGFLPGAGSDKAGETTGTYYDLNKYTLVSEMAHFKVVLTVGPNSAETVIEKKDFVKIVPNAVDLVLAVPVTVDGETYSSALTGYTMALSGTEDAKLTLRGVAGTLTEAQKTKLNVTASKYVAVRLYHNEMGASFTNENVSGATAYVYGADGKYVDLVIAIENNKTSYEITGLQAGKIILDLSGVEGLAVQSVFNAGELFFNAEGEFTAEYTFKAGTLTADSTFVFTTPDGSASPYVMQGANGAGITVVELKDQDGKTVDEQYSDFATLTALSAKFTKAAVSVSKAAFGNYTVAISDGGKVLVQDGFKPAKTYSNNEGATGTALDETGTLLAETANGKLYIAKILSGNSDIRSGDLVVNSLTLNFNAGNKDKVTLVKLEGTYSAGRFVTNDNSLMEADEEEGETATVVTTLYFDGKPDYAYDYDYIAIVRYEIDLSKIEDSGNFDLASDGDGSYYKIEGNKLTKTSAGSEKEEFLTENRGDCYDGALAAKPVKNGQTVVFYANARYIGGEHKDNGHGVCELCGSALSETGFGTGWFDAKGAYASGNVHVGDVFDLWVNYKSGSNPDGRLTVAVQEFLGSNYGGDYNVVRLDGSGWGVFLDGGWTGTEHVAYYKAEGEDEPTSGTDEFTRLHAANPYNTVLGTQAFDGSGEITESLLNEVLNAGATMRATVTLTDTQLLVRYRLFRTSDMRKTPYFDYTFVLETREGSSYKFDFTGFEGKGEIEDKLHVSKGVVNNSLVQSTAVAEGVNYATSNAGSTVAFKGMATKDGASWKAATVITFSQALVASTRVSVVGLEGATAVLGDDRTTLTVTLPLTATSLKSYTVRFENDEASTAQGDITLDLSELAVTDYAIEQTNTLNLTGGTLTLDITGATAGTTLAIGEASKAYADIAVNDAFGTLKVTAKTDSSISFVQTALDFTKKIENYVVKLTDGSGKLLAYQVIGIEAEVTEGTIVDNQVLVTAQGSKLTLVLTQGVSEGQTKELKLNANMGGAKNAVNKELLNNYDLSVKVHNGVATFTGSNVLTTNARLIYSAIDGSAVTMIIDLTKLGIVKGEEEGATDPAYGIQIYVGSTNAIYTVASNRTLTAVTDASGEAEAIQDKTCEANGISAKAYKDGETILFWYDIDVIVSSHAFPENGGLCTECGDVTGWKKEIKVGKTDNTVNTLEHGDNKAYNPAGTDKFSAIVSGQKIVAQGKLTSVTGTNWQGIGILLYKGGLFVNGDHARIDDWIDNGTQGAGNVGNRGLFVTKNSATLDGNKMNDARWLTYQSIKANAEATIIWDWTDASKVVLTIRVSGIDTPGNYEQIWTYTAQEDTTLGEKLSIGIIPINGSFTGTLTATANKTVVSAENCNPIKHTHVYDATNDRCPDDGVLNPAHEHDFTGGVCKCGSACLHEHITSGVCDDCGLVYDSVTDVTLGGFSNPLPVLTTYTGVTAKLNDGDSYTLVCDVTENANTAAWSGIVTQIWNADASKELVFQQGNNWSLPRDGDPNMAGWKAEMVGQAAVSDDNAGAIVDGVNKTGMKYSITVTRSGDTVTIVYNLYNATAHYVGTAQYKGEAVQNAGEVVLGFGTDAVVVSGAKLYKNWHAAPAETPSTSVE